MGNNADFAPKFGQNSAREGRSAGSLGGLFIIYAIYAARAGVPESLGSGAEGLIVTNVTDL